ALDLDGKEIPDWMKELAAFDPRSRRDHSGREEGNFDRGDRGPRPDRGRGRGRDRGRSRSDEDVPEEMDENGMPPEPQSAEGESQAEERGDEQPREREREQPRAPRSMRLPPPDAPMVWNGPLHAPVLRPAFSEEATIRWARKNQTVRAYRPSGIPNSPIDHSLQKASLVYNYKPEIDASTQRSPEESGERSGGGGDRGGRDRGGRGRDRDGGRGGRGDKRRGGGRDRDRDRQPRAQGPRPEPGNQFNGEDGPSTDQQPISNAGYEAPIQQQQRSYPDEDSIGNTLRPGERPAALSDPNDGYSDDEDIDDNIGNRLDAPPTSGHIGMNGEGAPAPRGMNNRGGRGGPRGPGGPGGQGGGGGAGGNRRRGGRSRRGGRGGRGGPAGPGGGGGGGNRGPSRPPFDNR
ncbi:MAG: hypothetical protein ACXVBE_12095, partial [Bdellovibrionota bacterium]